MKPIDFRNETFTSIQNRIAGSRAAVLGAWFKHGPCTTELLAQHSGISILSLRPRTTELLQLGFICLADEQSSNCEGNYRMRTPEEHQLWLTLQVKEARDPQTHLQLR